eukprot:EG_transcript_13343
MAASEAPRWLALVLSAATAALWLVCSNTAASTTLSAATDRSPLRVPIAARPAPPLRPLPPKAQGMATSSRAAGAVQLAGVMRTPALALPTLMAAAGVAAGAALGLLLGLRWLARGRGVTPGPRVAMYGAGGEAVCSRRAALLASGVSGAGLLVAPAAFARLPVPPEGYIRYRNPTDRYDFLYPESWLKFSGAGDTILYRSPVNPELALFMNISSPTASRYTDLQSLGDPPAVAARLKEQLLLELMSTRLGVRRESEVVSAVARPGQFNDKTYYDVVIRIRSYADANPLAATPQERPTYLEWDRHYLTTLTVANRRLYELRVEVPTQDLDAERDVLATIQQGFRAYDEE